jgi:ribosomal protein S18 acetylase RimI-like enzyme
MARVNTPIEIRVLRQTDLPALLQIDAMISGKARAEILKRRLERALGPGKVTTSLVAETGGRPVGFVIGDVLVGEFGAIEAGATIDTLGVLPELQGTGIAHRLLRAYVDHVRILGVDKVHTQVRVNDWGLLRFFTGAGFHQGQTINLELEIPGLKAEWWTERIDEDE